MSSLKTEDELLPKNLYSPGLEETTTAKSVKSVQYEKTEKDKRITKQLRNRKLSTIVL